MSQEQLLDKLVKIEVQYATLQGHELLLQLIDELKRKVKP